MLRNNNINYNYHPLVILTSFILHNFPCVAQTSTSSNTCDSSGICGPFSLCSPEVAPACTCLPQFGPNNPREWAAGNWAGGCTRTTPLGCGSSNRSADPDHFIRLEMLRLPNYTTLWVGPESECQAQCLSNCTCIAYAYNMGLGCMFWAGPLMDTRLLSGGSSFLTFIRVADSDLNSKKGNNKIMITLILVIGFISMSVVVYILWRWMAKERGKRRMRDLRKTGTSDSVNGSTLQNTSIKFNLEELPLFTFTELENATRGFSDGNKLGKGGFGPVYKGMLGDGREIAIKRLSKASGQGMQEFMSEVLLISKLQHKNLVRLMGCCVDSNERMLIYEYLPNKSLDLFLFDSSQDILDWGKRFNIIEGICRGLVYLHRDSRLKIIHRDLKPSNILLDKGWSPKISDFGMARILGSKQDHIDTVRVAGTRGYMAPEYSIEGRFSEKSDVFSFGVLMLEIACGRRNTSFYNHEGAFSLLGHVWRMWKENNIAAAIDPRIAGPSYRAEVVRCIHIGLLCVQELPQDRPTVSVVLSMLRSEIIELPKPKKLAIILDSNESRSGTSSSMNYVSLTMVDGR